MDLMVVMVVIVIVVMTVNVVAATVVMAEPPLVALGPGLKRIVITLRPALLL